MELSILCTPTFPKVAALTAILLSGCASIDRFYSENPNARHLEFLDYDGPLKAEEVVGMDLDSLLDVREADDYFLVGAADYNGPGNVDWTGAMVRLGRRLKAEKIDYFTRYLNTDSGTGVIPMTTPQTSTVAVWGPNGLRTVNVTTMSTTLLPYRYNIPRNEFHVLYFKKLKNPALFGIVFGPPDAEAAKKIGTRKVLTILRVVPGKIAWKNDLFEGDIIMEVNGLKATEENVLSFCKDSIGKKMKVRRGDKEIEVTIKAD